MNISDTITDCCEVCAVCEVMTLCEVTTSSDETIGSLDMTYSPVLGQFAGVYTPHTGCENTSKGSDCWDSGTDDGTQSDGVNMTCSNSSPSHS